MKPCISVVLPAYNAAASIAFAIDSIFCQSFKPYEIIVVDDGSTDGTCEQLCRFGNAIRILRQSNSGPGEARNFGVRESKGDWIAFLDADDTWAPHKLERQVAVLKAAPDVDVINCRASTKSGDRMPTLLTFDRLWTRNEVITSSVLLRRCAFQAVNGFSTSRELFLCEDYHLWLRLANRKAIANLAEELVLYSPTANSLSRNVARLARAEVRCLQLVAEQVGVPNAKLCHRVIGTYCKYSESARVERQRALSRQLLFESFPYGVTGKQIMVLALSLLPEQLLNMRRRVFESAEHIPFRHRPS